MKLYHYTCVEHLPTILGTGKLTTTESNIGRPTDTELRQHGHRPPQGPGPVGVDAAPRVVWLTTAAIPDAHRIGLTGSRADKTAVRITVDVDDAQPWVPWAKRHGINRRWLHLLTKGRDADSGTSSSGRYHGLSGWLLTLPRTLCGLVRWRRDVSAGQRTFRVP